MPSLWNQGGLFDRRCRKLPALVLPLALAACGTTITGLVSAPLPPDGGSKKDYHWKFESAELSLDVGAGNFHPRGRQQTDLSVLTIWMRFRAQVDGVEFYPHRVTLTPEEGETRAPVSVRGPYRLGLEARMRLPRGLECAGVGVFSFSGLAPRGDDVYFDPYYGTPDYVHVRPVSGH